jgi:hypothetical protein
VNADHRDLAGRPHLLRGAVVVWSAFVGAVLLTALLALAPDAWLLPPVHMRDQALMFLVLWLASTVPAGFAALLLAPRKEG